VEEAMVQIPDLNEVSLMSIAVDSLMLFYNRIPSARLLIYLIQFPNSTFLGLCWEYLQFRTLGLSRNFVIGKYYVQPLCHSLSEDKRYSSRFCSIGKVSYILDLFVQA